MQSLIYPITTEKANSIKRSKKLRKTLVGLEYRQPIPPIFTEFPIFNFQFPINFQFRNVLIFKLSRSFIRIFLVYMFDNC